MKFCNNTNFTLPKQSQRFRSVLEDGSRSLGLFWKENSPSYNRRNTVHFRPDTGGSFQFSIGHFRIFIPAVEVFVQKFFFFSFSFFFLLSNGSKWLET